MTEDLGILHVVSELRTGGTELNTIRLANALTRRGIRNVVVALTEQVDAHMCDQLEVPFEHFHRRQRPWVMMKNLAAAATRYGCSVIHGRSYVTWLTCAGAKYFAANQVRLVQSFHGPRTFRQSRLRRTLGSFTCRHFTDRYVAVSRDIAHSLQHQWRIPRSQIEVIHNGIDTGQFMPASNCRDAKRALNIPEEVQVIGCVGSLYKVKNQALLIEAFARATEFGMVDSQLVFLGEGPMREALELLARQRGISRRVQFLGQQADVVPYLHAMDVFVQPSIYEGSPTAVLEAMACGVAAVATPSAGCRELQRHCGLPLLVDLNDSESLTQVLLTLSQDSFKRQHIGQQGRRAVQQEFSFDRMVSAYEAMYRGLPAVVSLQVSNV